MSETTFAPSGEVKGLTDRPRLPRLGKIHLGIKKVSARGNEYPSAVDFFVVPEVVQSVYGPKPRELDVVFPSDEVGRVAGVSWKQYSSTRGKICWGDGERAVRTIDPAKLPRRDRVPVYSQDEYDAAIATADSKTTIRAEITCPAKDCTFAKRNLCKPVMNLMVMLPKVPGIGVYQLDTGSTNSIIDVRGGIEMVTKLSGGRLAGIPLKLRLEPMEVISPDDQKKKIVHTLKLISPATLGKVLLAGDRNLRELLMADEGSGRSVGLPELTQGREVPAPQEPETDLFPHADVIDTRGGSSVGAVDPTPAREDQPAAVERSRSTTEVAGSSPAPRSEEQLKASTEELMDELGIPKKERGVFERAYAGKTAELVKFLELQLQKRGKK